MKRKLPNLLTIIVPRHPERGPGIAAELRISALKAALRSEGTLPEKDTDIYVADTIGGFVHIGDFPTQSALIVILCGILGATAWNLLTWRFGVPSSSSHALVGGLAGTVILAMSPTTNTCTGTS